MLMVLIKSTSLRCFIGLDKGGYLVNIFLISPQKHMLWVLIRSASGFSYFSTKTCYGYSLEAPYRDPSNEYPQHMFSWRNKKNINTFGLKKGL